MKIDHAKIAAELAPLGWEWNPKTRKARYPLSAGLGLYLAMADRRDYSRLSASLIISPRVHVSEMARLSEEIARAARWAEHVAEILLSHHESKGT